MPSIPSRFHDKKQSPLSRALALALTGTLASHAVAQSADATPSEGSTLTLGTVNVNASSKGPLAARQVFSSVDILGASVLQDQHVDYSWQLLSCAPGVQVTTFEQPCSGRSDPGPGSRGGHPATQLPAAARL